LPVGRHVLLVGLGGMVGVLARLTLTTLRPAAPEAFPWVTFVENVAGAFALGVVLTVIVERAAASVEVRLAVCTGALGAFTTYSTFATELHTRLVDGNLVLATGYGLASVVGGLAAAVGGIVLARSWSRRPATGGHR
jgi:fluoride exporter